MFEAVEAGQHAVEDDQRITILAREGQRLAAVLGEVDDVALSLAEGAVDHITVDQHKRSHPRRCEVISGGRSQPTGADDEHARRSKLLLPFDADLVQQNVARVAQQLIVV